MTFLAAGSMAVWGESVPDLILVRIPALSHLVPQAGDIPALPSDRYMDGMQIVRLSPGDPPGVTVLTPDFHSACDPAVSFDGKQILFAGKKNAEDYWQIWRMEADGSDPSLLVERPGDCITPLYIGALFHLDDAAPALQIVFAGSESGWTNEGVGGSAFALYTAQLDGSRVTKITYNLSSDFDPGVLPNGRIVFTRWRRPGTEGEAPGGFHFLAVSNDGTDLLPYYGNFVPPVYKGMARIDPESGRVYLIESERPHWLGAGDLAYVTMRRPLHSHRVLARSEGGLYAYPCPSPDGGLLASFQPDGEDSRFGLYRIDPETGERLGAIYTDANWHCVDAQVLASHPPVKGRSSVVNLQKDTGVFYCLDVYLSDVPGLGDLPKGTIKQVRVLEGLPHLRHVPRTQIPVSIPFSGLGANEYTGTPFAARRLVGVAPVEDDGSFHIEIPAHTPVAFQLLDKRNMAVASQLSWSWVLPREKRGCIGCHENREYSPPNRMVKALEQKARQLTLPPERRRMVDFVHEIQPILETKCSSMGCHSPGGANPLLAGKYLAEHRGEGAFFMAAYETLLSPIEGRNEERYVVPGSAKDSPLIWQIVGERTGDSPFTGSIAPMPPHEALPVVEKNLLIEWIDLGALYDIRPVAEAADASRGKPISESGKEQGE